jgi:hypothetical protein
MSTNDRVSSSNLSKQLAVAHSACAGVDTVVRVDRGEFKSLNSLVISKYLSICGPNTAGVKLLEMEFLGVLCRAGLLLTFRTAVTSSMGSSLTFSATDVGTSNFYFCS